MICIKPFKQGGLMFPCGDCPPCRGNRRRIWAHRIMLEATQHEYNSFVTLTYSDDNLPFGGNLEKVHAQRWLKRLRKSLGGVRVRYYLVGEYGDRSWRPHYHVALFGFRPCLRGVSFEDGSKCCEACSRVYNTWGMGKIECRPLEDWAAEYIAGYVTKKMTNSRDPRLEGRTPEFATMSLKPGLGLDAMHDLADVTLTHAVTHRDGDVPVTLRHGPHDLPLGRYLRQKLRIMNGGDGKAPANALLVIQARMYEMPCVKKVVKADARPWQNKIAAEKAVLTRAEVKALQSESRRRIFNRRGEKL